MGRKIAWVAVRASSEEELLDRIGLEAIGEASDELNVSRAMTRLPSGWVIIVHAGFKISFAAEAMKASAGTDVLTGEVYENVMASGLRAYRDGVLKWSVVNDPDASERVQTQGRLPAAFEEVRKKLAAAENAEDIEFETPIQLADDLIGFDAFRGVDTVWSVVAPTGFGPAKLDSRAPLLSALIEDDLVAPLIGQGWRSLPAAERPKVWAPSGAFELYRRVGDAMHVVSFTFWETEDVFLHINFFVADETYSGAQPIIVGRVPPPRRSFWGRLLQPKKLPSREDRRRAAVEDAKSRLMALHGFLDGQVGDQRIQVDGGLAKDCWPAMPPRQEG